jgi:hypothetical protein
MDNIFKSFLGYCDLEGFCNSLDYFERLQKNLLAMIQKLGPSTFFVIFTSTKKLWDPFKLSMYTKHPKILMFKN